MEPEAGSRPSRPVRRAKKTQTPSDSRRVPSKKRRYSTRSPTKTTGFPYLQAVDHAFGKMKGSQSCPDHSPDQCLLKECRLWESMIVEWEQTTVEENQQGVIADLPAS
jgi:hypothetical protein